jgi:hypothetical protein
MENIFYTDGSMIDDVAGFTVYNRNYETEHQLVKPFSVFLAEISAIRVALEDIQICPCGRYLILSESWARFGQSGQEELHVRLILGLSPTDLQGPSAAQLWCKTPKKKCISQLYMKKKQR